MNISKLHIFLVDESPQPQPSESFIEGPSSVNLMRLGKNEFVELLNTTNVNFGDYNENSLYIIKNGNYINIKNLIKKINGFNVNIGRGGSQKSHLISPVELRLNSYLLAMHNFNYTIINSNNAFHSLEKNRYLLFAPSLKTYHK